MKSFWEEFKAFTLRGNVMNLAVGVIIGGAFQGVVSALTDNILSPLLGLFVGLNFDQYALELGGVTLGVGAFVTSIVNFLIMAFVIFWLVKGMNALGRSRAAEAPPAPDPRLCPYCKSAVHEEATRCPSCTSALEE